MENAKKMPGQGKIDVFTIVGMGLLTAVVVVLQVVAAAIHIGPFSITLCLAPIVVGAALYGKFAGMWLGFVFALVVLFTDPTVPILMGINAFATVFVVLLKSMTAGFAAGILFNIISKKSKAGDLPAVIVSGVAAPVINTGIFLLGMSVFFLDTVKAWGAGSGYDNVVAYMFLGLVGLNFLVELGINLVLSAAIVKIVRIGRKTVRRAKT